jgi:radical SAM protein with 4Fe4S-binding SPASM domain
MPQSPTLIEFDRRNPRLRTLPDEIQIEPIMGCNLKCPMCPVPDAPAAMNGRTPVLMKLDTYRRILGQIADRPRFVLLTVFGEPLLHPQIVEFIRLAKNDRHHVALITNGTTLSPEMADNLMDAGLNVLTISMDGLTKDTFESLRVRGSHDVVVGNLRALAAQNAERGYPLRIEINYVVSKRNESEVEGFFREFSPLVHRINFNPVGDHGGQFDLPLTLARDSGDPRVISRGSTAVTRLPCVHLWRGLAISAEGRIMLCCNDFKHESALPRVDERPLLDVWQTELERIRSDHVAGRFEAEPCRSCRVNAAPVRASAELRRATERNERRRRMLRAVVPRVLLSKRRRDRWREQDAPFGFLDTPVANAIVRGVVSVSGWSLPSTGRTIQQVAVRVDRAQVGSAELGHFRPDVGETHPGDEHSFSGFNYSLDSRCLSNGTHVLEAEAIDNTSERTVLDARIIVVENGPDL